MLAKSKHPYKPSPFSELKDCFYRESNRRPARPCSTIVNPMDSARIAELLEPFLRAPIPAEAGPSGFLEGCHYEQGQKPGEAYPERSRRESAVRSAKGQRPFLPCPEPSEGTNGALYRSISTYIDLLLRWNARINLTAIRDPEQIVTRHFGESLFAARILFPHSPSVSSVSPVVKAIYSPPESDPSAPLAGADNPAAERRKKAAYGASRGSDPQEAPTPEGRKNKNKDLEERQRASSMEANDQRPFLACPERDEGTNDSSLTTDCPSVADIGSGAGFPGLPIKLWAPHISLTLIESNHKKAAFLREITRALTLTDLNIQNARAETLPAQSFNLVTLRAIERFQKILPAAASLLSPAVTLALLIGVSQLAEAKAALPLLSWSDPIAIPQSNSRILATAIKRAKP